jgi:hypothetical protein
MAALTKTTVVDSAAAALQKVWHSPAGWLVSPVGKLAERVLGASSNREDAELARQLIEQGRRQGLRRLRVSMRRRASFDLAAFIRAVPAKVELAADGTVEIDAEYS